MRKFERGDYVVIRHPGGFLDGARAKVFAYDDYLDEYGEVEIDLLTPLLYEDGTEFYSVGSTLPFKEKYMEKVNEDEVDKSNQAD